MKRKKYIKKMMSKRLAIGIMLFLLMMVIGSESLIEKRPNIKLVKETKTLEEISSPHYKVADKLKKHNVKAKNIRLDKNKISLFKGETQYVHAQVLPLDASNKNVKWESENSSIAQITHNGQIIAKGIGKCKVFCVLQENKNVTQKVDVDVQEKYPTAIKVNPRNFIKLKEGQRCSIEAKVYPVDADDKTLKWSTSDSTVATVNNGIVAGKKHGSCIISAAIKDIPNVESSVKILVEGKSDEMNKKTAALKNSKSIALTSCSSKIIDVPYICQNPNFPTGCESVSTVMALNYAGVNISVDDFIDNYLKTTTIPFDPKISFGGDPREDGYGCYSPVIQEACKKVLKSKSKSHLRVKQLEKNSIENLCHNYIDNNIPVIVWATRKMLPAKISQSWEYAGRTISWISPEHCLLLVGYDRNYYYFNDPLECKQKAYSKSDTKIAYGSMGYQAVVIV